MGIRTRKTYFVKKTRYVQYLKDRIAKDFKIDTAYFGCEYFDGICWTWLGADRWNKIEDILLVPKFAQVRVVTSARGLEAQEDSASSVEAWD